MRHHLLIATAAIACLASGCGSTQVTSAPAPAPAPVATPTEAPATVIAPEPAAAAPAPVAAPEPVAAAPAPMPAVAIPAPAAAPEPVTMPVAPVAEAAPVAPAEPPRSVWPAEVASGATVYLADLAEIGVKVGFGSFGRNSDLGYDKGKITVKGVVAEHGLSTHSPSFVLYQLGKRAATFKATAAVDDSAAPQMRLATFRVLGDGKVLWESKPMNQGQEDCSVDVAEIDGIMLEVETTGGDKSNDYAHTVWVDPQVVAK